MTTPGRRKRRGAALGPLRKVIGYDTSEHGVRLEVLECGHSIHEKQDIIGPTNAYRRRCRHCLKDAAGSTVDKA